MISWVAASTPPEAAQAESGESGRPETKQQKECEYAYPFKYIFHWRDFSTYCRCAPSACILVQSAQVLLVCQGITGISDCAEKVFSFRGSHDFPSGVSDRGTSYL